MQVIPIHVKNDVQPADSLVELLLSSSKATFEDGDVLVISQKVISKHEGQVVNLQSVIPSELSVGIASAYDKDPKLVEVILSESERIVRMENGVIIVQTKHGFICANAGIDESNVEDDYATLLPKDSDNSAQQIRLKILQQTGKKIAVIISDTFGRPFRMGQTDHAIGISGIDAILHYEGTPDTFGKILRVTATAVVDELCSAAELVMGKTKKCPAAIIKNFEFKERTGNIQNIIRSKEEDLFR
ncbi:MAG: coenzyme F420-0:L-glutamate ligase [Candidatus Nitrosopelagicus sp.]|nr:coenzyme F420-0:L-glutamate ligase [Candidatus Nitrosopelagicus sp.]MBT6647033.1 coenzyme F420-0:L-glutamate ligase [Nitrososphaerota archaeon]MBT3761748.1 coenzyme F420-0:L-glutamate ligase [Candidatus Nitrosopelagicus sp.]MBT4325917.1 coenzyme F420-0:L-glutamate ligase [Candidatus Nitrosopelagicus sp.]MBT4455146.1 coenzyme F420-0:L-glutamate ligase [Candidatus Nitrosopelagicus sp.]